MNRNRRSATGTCRYFFYLTLIAACLLLARSTNAQDTPYPDWRFGVVEAHEAPHEASALGAAWTRIVFHWAEVQAEGPDAWTPRVDETQIEAEVAAGRLVVGLLIGIPDWARTEDGLPAGLWRADDDPQNLWAQYVRQTVGHYKGRIDHWIIWNEPDIWDHEAPGNTWEGSVEDFAQLQKVAYRVAKATNPVSIIHLPAFTYYWDANYGREQYFALLLDELAADPYAVAYNHFFDVATAHLYFQPDYVYDILGEFQRIARTRGLEKPFWLVETNAPPINDPAWPVSDVTLRVTLGEQAAFMPQVMALALAAGAERIAVYKLKDIKSDINANPEPFGLLRMDGSRRPAFTTYRVAANYFSGARAAERERWDAVGRIKLDQETFTTTVLFSRLPQAQEVRIAAQGERAFLVDMWGNQQALLASNDSFAVTLPPAYCSQSIGDYCMIGSTVYYLIQAKEGHELPTTLPAPRLSPTNPPPPTPAHTVAPTATPTPTLIPSPTPTTTATRQQLATEQANGSVTMSGASVTPGATPSSQPIESWRPSQNSWLDSGYWLAAAVFVAAFVIMVTLRRR